MKYRRYKSKNLIPLLLIIICIYLYNNTDILMNLIKILVFVLLTVIFVYYYKKDKKIYNNYSLDIIDSMTGTEFEIYLINLYKSKGYNVKHIGGSGDYGADLILTKNYEKIVIQAKNYSRPVGVKAVQEVISAKEYYKGTRAIVVTNNIFTNNAKTMAQRCNVTLIDRNSIMKI